MNVGTALVRTVIESGELKQAEEKLGEYRRMVTYVQNTLPNILKGKDATHVVSNATALLGPRRLTPRVVIGLSSRFLVLDAVDLGSTIRDLVLNEGTEAAKI